MDEETDRMADLEARIIVLQQLLLSHILASDHLTPGVAAATAEHAETQVRSYREKGRGLLASRLALMAEAIREVASAIPAND